jgi:AraC-like DNA-binding protein/quercetin dioxygenase-like cupin family protein
MRESDSLHRALTTVSPVAFGSAIVGRVITDSFRVQNMRYAADLQLPPHFHDEPILTIPLRGQLELSSSRRRIVCRAGTVFTLPAGERHSSSFGGTGAHSLVIAPIDLDQCIFPAAIQIFRSRQVLESPRMAQLAAGIVTETRQSDAVTGLAVDAMVLQILALALRCELSIQSGRRPIWLRRAVDFIYDASDRRLSLAEIAAAAGVSPAELPRAFRRAYGVSIAAFARAVRLDRAAERLERGHSSLDVIARDAGFVDQSHFTRAFKRSRGVTPGQYRRDHGW